MTRTNKRKGSVVSLIDLIFPTVIIGLGATAFMDMFAWLQRSLWNIQGLDYALVGRWIAGIPKGQFTHKTILQSPQNRYERTIGWVFHYAIGVLFAGIMLAFTGKSWLDAPSLLNPMIIGIASVAAPFLVMQPAFGFGFAASKTPSPWITRQKSLIAHLSFGLGTYLTGVICARLSLW
ncbi:DUF2938 domain-containing protein [Lentilitoribacter sp. Alg239-R112]|uniref:DUF2938 domain-containing protein n=1 Tax=Lentilitoribacter sp. Alg239-R112 TaxID=2305987 RepID=UPI0013A6B504|nr:DUF2938 domain-containing protein [Lentilitoribacter sp. Alg239-R112]